jgi:hypothetical protein
MPPSRAARVDFPEPPGPRNYHAPHILHPGGIDEIAAVVAEDDGHCPKASGESVARLLSGPSSSFPCSSR